MTNSEKLADKLNKMQVIPDGEELITKRGKTTNFPGASSIQPHPVEGEDRGGFVRVWHTTSDAAAWYDPHNERWEAAL